MLVLQNIALVLARRVLIQPFSLVVKPGETVTLMGPSGSGKSSLLSFIGGDLPEEIAGSGTLLLNGKNLDDVPPEQRRIARLFQDDLLFPHMTVAENLLFAVPKMPKPERMALVAQALKGAGLSGFEDRPPHTLSGGERSRIALLRALLAQPAAILLDEPFSKLDEELRQAMRDHTFRHIAAKGIPALLVTHDRNDAPPGGRVLRISKVGEVFDV